MLSPILVDYWFFYLPSYLLAVLMWACLGRFLLSLFFAPEHPNNIWRAFRRLTDPVIRWVGYITPGFMLPILLPLVAAFWLLVARFFFWVAMYSYGLAPRLSDYGLGGG